MQNPYKYSYHKTSGTYQFTTKNNVVYSIVFVVDYTLSSISSSGREFDNIYQIIIEKISDELEPFDSSVFLTVDSIIHDFFKNEENALIYICSNDHGKDAKRFKVFDRWYQNSNQKNTLLKIDNIVRIGDGSTLIYTALLYHKNNSTISDILETFNEIESVLNSEK